MRTPSIQQCFKNLQVERNNEALYTHLAELSDDSNLALIYQRIARGEAANAAFWEKCLNDQNIAVPVHRLSARTRILARLAQWFGPGFVMPMVVRLEHADHEHTPVDRHHYQNHFVCINPHVVGTNEHGSGNTLRAAVLGANDGLVSNASLVMGMAGAATAHYAILLAGMAGLVAGACSMALGEWLSVNSSREFYQARITERAERLAVAPEASEKHIADIYRNKGMMPEEAQHLAKHLTETPHTALDTVVREDLGVDPSELGGSAWVAALSSFICFALGATFPVIPYFFLTGAVALFTSMTTTFIGLCLIATGTSLFTGRGLGFSILRQLVITTAAAGITYGVGSLIGILITT